MVKCYVLDDLITPSSPVNDRLFGRKNLGEREAQILRLLARRPGMRTRQVAETLNISYKYASKLLLQMYRRGLLLAEEKTEYKIPTRLYYAKILYSIKKMKNSTEVHERRSKGEPLGGDPKDPPQLSPELQ